MSEALRAKQSALEKKKKRPLKEGQGPKCGVVTWSVLEEHVFFLMVGRKEKSKSEGRAGARFSGSGRV